MAWIPIAASAAGALVGSLLNKQRGPEGSTTGIADPWAPTIPYLNQIMQQIQGYGNQPAPYGSPGEMVAGLTPEQQAASGMVGQQVGQAGQLTGQANQAMTPFLQGKYMNAETNPYLQQAIQSAIRPITQNYQENVLPQIGSNFSVGSDVYDQSREGIAKGIASRGYLDAVSGVSSAMQNRGYETGLQATQNAMTQVPGLTTATMQPGQQLWNIGALLQAQNQNVANAPGAFDQMQQQRLQFPANIYTQIGQIGRQGTTTTPGVSGNPYLGALGGGILGQQLYNMWPTQPTAGGSSGQNLQQPDFSQGYY